MTKAHFTTPSGNTADAEIPGVRLLNPGEKVHLSEAGGFCHACLCDLNGEAAWMDRKAAWEDRKDKCL